MRTYSRARSAVAVVTAATALIAVGAGIGSIGAANAVPVPTASDVKSFFTNTQFKSGQQVVLVSQGQGTGPGAYTIWYTATQDANGQAVLTPFDANPPADTQLINAIGFDENSGYAYGIGINPNGSGTNHLVQVGVDSTGATIATFDLGAVTGLPAPQSTDQWTYNSGTMGVPGLDCSALFPGVTPPLDCGDVLFIKNSNSSSTMYAIDTKVGSSAFQTARAIPLTAPLPNSADMFFVDGYLWSVFGNPSTGAPQIYRVDLALGGGTPGTVSQYSLAGLGIGGNCQAANNTCQSYGAQWVYGNGNFGILGNSNGTVFQISITNPSGTPTFTVVSTLPEPGITSSRNDGTSYLGLPVNLAVAKTITAVANPAGTPQTVSSPAATTAAPGDTITFGLAVSNTEVANNSSGYVLTDIIPDGLTNPTVDTSMYPNCSIAAVTDPVTGVATTYPDGQPVMKLTCVGGPLTHGSTATYAYTATLAATASTAITNTAKVLGNERDPDPTDNTSSATVTPAVLALVKTANPSADLRAGNPVTYSFTITNNGADPVTNLAIGEVSFSGSGTMTTPACPTGLASWTSGTIGTLNPGGSVTCTATYTVTAADVAAGSLTNTAVATGKDSSSNPVTSPDSTVTTTVDNPALTVTKTATPDVVTAVGQVVDYTIVATNTGNVRLTAVAVTDTLAGPTLVCPDSAWTSGVPGTLNVGDSVTCTASHTTTAADVTAGGITNVATAEGLPPTGGKVTNPGGVNVPVVVLGLTLTKSISDPGTLTLGEQVVYSFTMTNTGNTTLSGLTLADTFTGSGTAPAITGCQVSGVGTIVTLAQVSLAPGAKAVCTDGYYTVTAADVARGTLHNDATVTGTPNPGARGSFPADAPKSVTSAKSNVDNPIAQPKAPTGGTTAPVAPVSPAPSAAPAAVLDGNGLRRWAQPRRTA